jgi:Peptidase family S41
LRLRLPILAVVLLWFATDRELLLTAPAVRRIQFAAASDLEARYVDPAQASRLGAYLRHRPPEWVTLAPLLAVRLSAELRFPVGYNWAAQELSPVNNATPPPPTADERSADQRDHFGIGPITVAADAATIPIRRFGLLENAEAPIAQAFATVRSAPNLVFDLRNCQDAVPGTALLWASYLFPEQIYWATLQYRGFTEEYWTLPKVTGPRFTGPVTVLTSARTASACQGFAFALQAHRRATIVGETAPGLFSARRQVTEHFWLLLPEARPWDEPYRKPPSDPPAKPGYTAGSSINSHGPEAPESPANPPRR